MKKLMILTLALLLMPLAAFASPSNVAAVSQAYSYVQSGSLPAVAQQIEPGDTIIVGAIAYNTRLAALSTVTDTAGNVYALVRTYEDFFGTSIDLWEATAATEISGDVVSFTNGLTSDLAVGVSVYRTAAPGAMAEANSYTAKPTISVPAQSGDWTVAVFGVQYETPTGSVGTIRAQATTRNYFNSLTIVDNAGSTDSVSLRYAGPWDALAVNLH